MKILRAAWLWNLILSFISYLSDYFKYFILTQIMPSFELAEAKAPERSGGACPKDNISL